ncbi:MAG: hypothetical protein AAFV33_08935 [Chloroflexota bacterium]
MDEITLDELKVIVEKLLQYHEQKGDSTLPIIHEYYWNIATEQRYNPHVSPTDFTIGQLSFDLQHLREIAGGDREPTGYALVWLGQLLIAIGGEEA